jgi:hypothetical protein
MAGAVFDIAGESAIASRRVPLGQLPVLSRLISLLRRIPAVKWAFTKLRPLPHGGSIDVAPDSADASPALVAEIAEAAPPLETSISAEPSRCDAAVAAPATEDDTAISVIADSPSAAATDVGGSDDSSRETPTQVEPIVGQEASLSPVEIESEPVDAADLTSNDPLTEISTGVDFVIAEEAPVSSVDAAMEIAPVPASDPAPAAAIAADEFAVPTPSVVADVAPELALEAPALEITSAPKTRAKIAEPADRAALIRQRWAETGIRMWNPRLHGAGDATLNIQGSVGLLPPAPGETMPRYDKLEFRMLGGQIACEGVIVEAPAHASQRSFTRLAEPGKPDRVREPMRERQSALA